MYISVDLQIFDAYFCNRRSAVAVACVFPLLYCRDMAHLTGNKVGAFRSEAASDNVISIPPSDISSTNLQGPVSWKQEPLAAPTRRGWDWIYHSLWLASDGAKAACKANVPSTVLFHAGEPRRWIHTDDNGRAVRRQFPKPPKSSGGGRSVVREIRLRAVWDGLLRFSEQIETSRGGV